MKTREEYLEDATRMINRQRTERFMQELNQKIATAVEQGKADPEGIADLLQKIDEIQESATSPKSIEVALAEAEALLR